MTDGTDSTTGDGSASDGNSTTGTSSASATVSATDGGPMESIDWERLDSSGWSISWRLVGLVAAFGVLAAMYRYAQVRNTDVFLAWSPTPLTWVFRSSLVVLAFLFVPPLLENPQRTRRYWRRFRSNRVALASLGYLAAFTALALVGPVLMGRPWTDASVGFQPPAFFTVPYGTLAQNCVGPIVGPKLEPSCVGTLQYPLGTTELGKNMITVLLSGMYVSLQVAVITVVLMIPVATAVGIVSGYVGGSVDTVLMRYVDVQQSVPAFVVYIILVFVFGPSLLLLVVVFGLLNWGSIARLVRSEVLQRRAEPYIEVARGAGVSQSTILRRHVLPNVSNTVLVGATQKIPRLVLVETALTFIGLGVVGRRYQSFGETIAAGFGGGFGHPAQAVWWLWVLPVVVLSTTVIALGVVGDALRDVLDPRGEP